MRQYELSIHELFEPLSENDSQRFESYKERVFEQEHRLGTAMALKQEIAYRKKKATIEEQKRLTELEEQSSEYALNDWEQEDWTKLRARRRQQKLLTDYRYEVKDSAFAEFNPPQVENWCGGFNLPAMVKQYEQTKAVCGTVKASQHFARREQNDIREHLAQLDQKHSILWQQLNPENNLSEAHKAILSEVLGELFEQFLQHIEQDAGGLPDNKVKPVLAAMKSEDYNVFYLARVADAEVHDKKIAALRRSRNYTSWWELRDKEPHFLVKSGNGQQSFYYPKPYSEKYFWRFLNLIMRIPFANIKPELRYQFFGDQVDRDYIEGLLLQAEHENHLNKEGCVVLANADDSTLTFPEPYSEDGWAFGKYPDGLGELSDSAYFGGKDFQQRAVIIREWCQDMASIAPQELSDLERDMILKNVKTAFDESKTPITSESPDSDFAPIQLTRAELDITDPTRAAPSTTRKSKVYTTDQDPRDGNVELEEFLIGTSTKFCDILAETVGFRPPAVTRKHKVVRPFEKVGDGPTARIYAIADFMDSQHLIKARKKTRLVIAMGKRLGYPNDAPANTKGAEYASASRSIKTAFADEVKSLEEDKAKESAQNKKG